MKHNFKLSKRLQQIEQMVTPEYNHIWDCCCDHGLLGLSLLSHQTNSKIHFVDIVPELMATLENKLERFYKNFTWQSHCIDVAKLPLKQYDGRHLIIIAGIGGDLMIKFIEAIHQQHKHLNIDFLLCPVHHQFSLRQKLIELDFNLKNEVLIEENQRFYEILLVSSAPEMLCNKTNIEATKVSPVGDKIWQSTSSQQNAVVNRYLQKTLSHYQRINQGYQKSTQHNSQQVEVNKVLSIINAYSTLVR